mmetsp:Transcript_14864/g.46565  ORF Transcript_14864/g.46565 Transcript_14864/m.46565 type:complete len:399 (-) Transcript_14864:22-1218(-)
MAPPAKIAIVGCGLSGLGAVRSILGAARSASRPISIQAFDKATRVGGRCWTTTLRPGLTQHAHTVDTGAQYATLRPSPYGTAFSDWFAAAAAAGHVAPWYLTAQDAKDDQVVEEQRGMLSQDGHTYRYTGVGGMRAMADWTRDAATALASDIPGASLAWHTSQRIGRIEKSSNGSSYLLFSDPSDELVGEFGAVLLAMPAPQVADLLAASGLPVPANLPTMEPVVAFAFPVPTGDAAWAKLAAGNFAPRDSTVVSWLARNSTKAGQQTGSAEEEAVLVHSTPAFAATARAEAWTKDKIRAELARAVEATFGVTVPPVALKEGLVHQWRYARASETSGDGTAPTTSSSDSPADPFVRVAGETCLVAAGDWAVPGGRVQGAFESGTLAGEHLFNQVLSKL